MDVDDAPTQTFISREASPMIISEIDVELVENSLGLTTMASLLPDGHCLSASASPSIAALALLASEVDGDATPPPTAGTDIDQWPSVIEEDLPRPFDTVSNDLKSLGALSLSDFLSNVSANVNAVLDVNFYVQLPEPPGSPKEEGGVVLANGTSENDQAKTEEMKAMKGMVSMLHEASHRVFGSSDCLKFEYLEEDPKDKQCVLTITRPNGSVRSYKSEPASGFTRRQEARMQAAKIAVEMGAVDFILSGETDCSTAKKGQLLNPFDVEVDLDIEGSGSSRYNEEEKPLRLIEDTCTEWRAGKVKPHWVTYNDFKNKKKHGAALRISLNAHVFRSYSVDPIYSYQRQAKLACARTAVDEGVIDFIKHGNGQTQPAKSVEVEDEMQGGELASLAPAKGMTLQEFFNTLPRPFPEDVGDVPANDINAPAWVNLRLQSARGGRLLSSYIPVVDGICHLHGCILRIHRPRETRTYLVDPRFPKRADAKSAVCLLAMSQGVGNWIRGLKEETDKKLSSERRRLANEKVIQALFSECAKVKPGNRLIFDYTAERDAFGCILKVDVSENEPDVRVYTVDSEYRNKADAKAAVACHAAEQGLIDLLRFKGGPLPPDYVPFWQAEVHGDGDRYVAKRKDRDRDVEPDDQDRKRRKSNFKETMGAGEFISQMRAKLEAEAPDIKPYGLLRGAPQPPTGPSVKSVWQKARPSMPSGFVPNNRFAPTSRPVDRGRVGDSSYPPTGPRGYVDRSSSATSPSHQPHPREDQRGYGHNPAHTRPPPPHAPASQPVYRTGPPYQAPPPAPYPTDPYARPDQGSRHHYPQPAAPYHSPPPAPHVQYPAPADPYAGGYAYPPPPPAHYPPAAYPPPPPAPHYPAYYPTPSVHPPPPPPYGHYQYPQYPPHYPGYPPPQPLAHPGHYASPPPPPHAPMPVGYPPNVMASSPPPTPQYLPRYRSPYSPPHQVYSLSPPQPPPHGLDYMSSYDRPANYRPSNNQGDQMNGRHNGHSGHNRPRDTRPGQDRGSVGPPRTGQSVSVKEEPTDERLVHEPPAPPEPPIEAPPLPDTNLAALFEFCQKEDVPRPKFLFGIVDDKDGEKKFKVWAEHHSQRLELPTLFSNYEDGRERLAKRVLQWVRSRMEQKKN